MVELDRPSAEQTVSLEAREGRLALDPGAPPGEDAGVRAVQGAHPSRPSRGADDRLLGNLEQAQGGLTVSPDGKTILYTKVLEQGADLMMIENFR